MTNVPSTNNQPIKQTPSIRIMTPANVAIPAQKPTQAVNPQIPAAHRNSFTPSGVKVPVSQPTPSPRTQEGENNG